MIFQAVVSVALSPAVQLAWGDIRRGGGLAGLAVKLGGRGPGGGGEYTHSQRNKLISSSVMSRSPESTGPSA